MIGNVAKVFRNGVTAPIMKVISMMINEMDMEGLSGLMALITKEIGPTD
jgi:hypothetical protein